MCNCRPCSPVGPRGEKKQNEEQLHKAEYIAPAGPEQHLGGLCAFVGGWTAFLRKAVTRVVCTDEPLQHFRKCGTKIPPFTVVIKQIGRNNR